MSRLVFLSLWLAMALHFAWTRHHLSVQYAPGALEALMAGTAATPFQYRALVPWLAAGLAHLTEWGPGPLFFLLDAVSCLGLLAALSALTRPLLGDGTARAGLALLAWLALPSLFLLNPEGNFRYPYDLPSIIVFALGLMLLRAGRLRAFLILLVLGTLNRETTLFLIPAFLATHRDRLPRGRLILHAGLQVAAWAAVKAGLALLYAGNAGPGAMSWRSGDYTQAEQGLRLLANAAWLASPPGMVGALGAFGFTWLPTLLLFRRSDDPFTARAAWMAPLFLVAVLLGANVWEMRVYGEMLPLLVLAWAAIARRFVVGRVH